MNEDIGLHFKAPTNWRIDEDPYFSAEDYMTDNCITIYTSQLSGVTVEEYIDVFNSSVKSMVGQSGLSVSISSLKTATLGGTQFKMETVTMSNGSTSISQHLYFAAS